RLHVFASIRSKHRKNSQAAGLQYMLILLSQLAVISTSGKCQKSRRYFNIFSLHDGTRWNFDDRGGRERGKILTQIPEFETVSGRTPYFCHNLWFISLTNANDPPVLRNAKAP